MVKYAFLLSYFLCASCFGAGIPYVFNLNGTATNLLVTNNLTTKMKNAEVGLTLTGPNGGVGYQAVWFGSNLRWTNSVFSGEWTDWVHGYSFGLGATTLGKIDSSSGTALVFTGDGNGLTNLNASELRSGTIPFAQAGRLTNHTDVVSAVPPAAGDILAYNSINDTWTNGPPVAAAASTGITNGWKATLTLGGTINITNLSSGLNMVNDQGQSGVVGPINTVTPAYALAPDSGITMWGTNAVTTNGLSAIQQVPAAYFGLGNGSAIRTFLDITNTYPFARFGGNTNAFSVSTTAGAYVFGVHTNGSTFDGVGIIIKSNTLASIPPLLPGDVYIYSSNGIAFRILVGPTGTRTTNTW